MRDHRGAEIDYCEDDHDRWYAVCAECGWQSPPAIRRRDAVVALAAHQANPVAAPPETKPPATESDPT